MAVNVEKIQAEVIEDFSRKATEVSLPEELVDLVREVTSDAVFISFPLLLSVPVFKKLLDVRYASSLDLLRLFAYGTWRDYKGNSGSFPPLLEEQVWKLKQLTLLTLARSCKVLTYVRLRKLLDFREDKDLENFLETCDSLGIVKGKLNKQQNCFEVLYAVDSLGKSHGKAVGKYFDIFLDEARRDFTGTNGIVHKVLLPSDGSSDCSMTELQSEPSSLFSSLVQHMVDAHAMGKSYDGLIYAAMFAVAGDRLRGRPEAAPWKELTPERFSKDRKAVASILRKNTGLKVSYRDRYGIKREVMYPIYMLNLLDHLEGKITNLNKGHSDHPMSMAFDKSYGVFLVCHPTFLGYAPRSVVFWYVRTYNKSSSIPDQTAFRNAMSQIKINRVDWHHALKNHWLFQKDFQLANYKNSPEDCFRLIRDWETHVQRSLSERQKILYTAAIINYLVAYHFDDFLPQATYHMLCTYSKLDNKFDLINWIQRLRRLSEEDTATLMMEWDQLGFHGFINKNVLQHQINKIVRDLEQLRQNPIDGPSGPSSLAKWRLLNILRGKNETMYYKVLIENIDEYAHIVYASTIRVLCQKSSGLFRSSSGLYLSAKDKGHMASLFQNSSAIEIDMVVVTDGRSVSGFDDLGVNGIGIAIGKLDLYVAAAGINPCRVLPVMIDVGTDNEKLRKDPLYHGIHGPRLDEQDFDVIVHELLAAVSARWPKAIVQFEGFGCKLSLKLLEQYKTMYRVFNDDIQGANGVMIAGLLGVLKAQGKSLSDFPQLRIVVAGLDSSGIAILDSLRVMARMSGNCTASLESYMSQLWIVDAYGLLTEDRKDVDADTRPFARKKSELQPDLYEGACIADVVKKVKPDIVLILSAAPNLSSQEVLEAVKDLSSSRPAFRPAIFAMPSSGCTAKDAFTTLGENIIFACGDQFPNMDLGNGKIGYSNHVNNMYLFPGIALGTLLSGASHVSDDMMFAAARCLASLVKEDDILNGILYPPVSSIRDISKEVASAVLAEATAKGLAKGHGEKDPLALAKLSKEDIMAYVESNMWRPSLCTT